MGVYFPNMKMPRCCYECDLCYDCFYCKSLEVSFYDPQDRAFVPDGFDPAKERLPNCTAFNVPPHGDLVDRREMDVIGFTGTMGRNDTFDDGVMWLAEQIDGFDTIIPASE